MVQRLHSLGVTTKEAVVNAADVVVFPVPVGAGRVIKIQFPADMTKAEAEKVCKAAMALAT